MRVVVVDDDPLIKMCIRDRVHAGRRMRRMEELRKI